MLKLLLAVPIIGALVSGLASRKRGGGFAALAVTSLVTLALAVASYGQSARFTLCGALLTFSANSMGALYAIVAPFMWLMCAIFSPMYFHGHGNEGRYCVSSLLTLAGSIGLFLATDLYAAFICFEVMSFSSYCWVAHEESAEAMRAAETYLAIAVVTGMATLMGLFMLYGQFGTLSYGALAAACDSLEDRSAVYLAAALTFAGFAAKAGLFPLHVWLPKAHPVAPAPASALLSGLLTKCGVFGMIFVTLELLPGDVPFATAVMILGVITMLLGAVMALFSTNIKRVLACSSLSQIGFIVVGIAAQSFVGSESYAAVRGVAAHMLNHSAFKLILFLCAGAVYAGAHALELDDVRGYGRGKPLLHAVFLSGALGIACVPPFSGFVSKSLLHEGLLEAALSQPWLKGVEWLFMLSGGLTLAYMLKLYITIFWEKNASRQAEFDALNKKYVTRGAACALAIPALLPPLLGCVPAIFSGLCGIVTGQYEYLNLYTLESFEGAVISLSIGVIIYLLLARPLLMVNRWPKWLDMEEKLYRPLTGLAARAGSAVCTFIGNIPESKLVLTYIPACVTFVTRALFALPDMFSLALKRAFTRAKREPESLPVGSRFTDALGRQLNRLTGFVNRIFRRRNPGTTDFIYLFAAGREEMGGVMKRITRSVSFGLLLLCVGLYLTLRYLLG